MTRPPVPEPASDGQPNVTQLGAVLKARRRAQRLSLRDLAAEIGVSLNTLSRVERGYVPELKNFQRIVDWLDVPAEAFLEPADTPASTPEIIARHLRSDQRLTDNAAAQIAQIVEEMYYKLAGERQLALHLRSAQTFTPAAGALLAEILTDMRSTLLGSLQERD
ncbi:MAG TPA: helix-turn-helix transcriptional regulator [Kribbella sp.]